MAKPKQKVRRRAKPADFETYLFRIVAIEPSYLLSSLRSPSGFGDTGEYLHLEIQAVCEAPTKLKGRDTELTLLASRAMMNGNEREGAGIGSLTMRGGRSEYLGSIPMDVALALPSSIATGGYRWIQLHGESLKYGMARIRSLAFFHDVDPDDY